MWGSMMQKRIAVADGANVALAEKSDIGDPKVSNLVSVHRVLIVDASPRHKVDDPDLLESLIDDQMVRQAPAGTDADYFVIETAEQLDGLIISNDRYNDFQEENGWIEERRIRLMIVEGEVELYEKEGEV